MMLSRRRFLAISVCALAGAAKADSRVAWRGRAFGADATISVNHAQMNHLADQLSLIIHELDNLERTFSLYIADSEISRLNRDGYLHAPSAALVEVLEMSKQLHKASGGLFDPSVQPLWQALAWGGDAGLARQQIGFGDVHVSRSIIRLGGSDMAITLNGIAQGFATDRIASLLADLGFPHSLVNVGEYAANRGQWTIGVQNAVGRLLSITRLNDSAIATSSADSMMLGEFSHILHPSVHRGYRWKTASVEAKTATFADGLSTALIHSSLETARQLSQTPGVKKILLERRDGRVIELAAGKAPGSIAIIQPQ